MYPFRLILHQSYHTILEDCLFPLMTYNIQQMTCRKNRLYTEGIRQRFISVSISRKLIEFGIPYH